MPAATIIGIQQEFGVVGLILGFALGSVTQFVIYSMLLKCKDWQEVADEAVDRIRRESENLK